MGHQSPAQERSPRTPTAGTWHAWSTEAVAEELGVGLGGLSRHEAATRLAQFGPNRIEPPRPTPRWRILLRQFQSPLIYILLAATVIATSVGEYQDASFIVVVLLLNAVIGFLNEFRAEREVLALASVVRGRARVRRDRHARDIDGEDVVPGDLLLLESGMRVCADVRLLDTRALRVDESLLTGESLPVAKEADEPLPEHTALADRRNLVFAGTMVASGRGSGLVVATGGSTAVGAIAARLAATTPQPPPLVLSLERFARLIGWVAMGLIGVILIIGTLRGEPFGELLLGAVALAVSAVPEGLPIALTVTLAVAVSRMAKRRVVIRHLPAVEALGSCGVICTDKTGTLTRNELTVEHVIAGGRRYAATGTGYVPEGELRRDGHPVVAAEHPALWRLLRVASLANESSLAMDDHQAEGWVWSGDPTDVALLALALKADMEPVQFEAEHESLAMIPFEPERRYAASFHRRNGGGLVCVKGAPERVLAMCDRDLDPETGRPVPLDAERWHAAIEELMGAGQRVIALADDETPDPVAEGASPPDPSRLVLLGLVGMSDPPREEVADAVDRCRQAGIQVVMVTGDHATTARVIAHRVGIAEPGAPVLDGEVLAGLDEAALRAEVGRHAIVARVTPDDKLRVVQAWQMTGAYVAVTGDGVNDAPALRQANLGVAMGRTGIDVAREASELIITDDNFASIVAGVEEGRVAYDNVRKVIYLLISTGAAEVTLMLSALTLGLGVPLTAVQLLWLNLVTNGIQDVALGFEPGEPEVLHRPPRPPSEPIFDRLMIERTLLAAAVMGGISLWLWWSSQDLPIGEARNLIVQLFVLFEILHIGNARSERISVFRLNPLRNPLLFLGTGLALGLHLLATYTPFFQGVLGVRPIPLSQWLTLLMWASSVLVVMELHKWWWRRRHRAILDGTCGRAEGTAHPIP
jgi:P-type Ca2+ transporter type 2C